MRQKTGSMRRATGPRMDCAPRRRMRAAIEVLETRVLLSAIGVNTFVDQTDPPTSPVVSLRDALALAASNPGPDTINLAAGNYNLTQGELLIGDTSGEVTVQAIGGNAVLDAQQNSRVMETLSNTSVILNGLTITGGAADNAAGIQNSGVMTIINSTVSGNATPAYDRYYMPSVGNGGGIFNSGTLTIADSTVSANSSNFAGGGIENTGTITLTGSTISSNSTTGHGGGIDNNSTLAITNSTLSQNGSIGQGGALCNTGSATFNDSTVTQNVGTYGTGGIDSQQGTSLTLGNTLVAGNGGTSSSFSGGIDGPDVVGTVTSLGHNLIGQTDGSTGWIANDLTGTSSQPLDPLLAPLGNYGGPTLTQAPLAGSPAAGQGSVALLPNGLATDQRGLPRVANGQLDIGAVELQRTSIIRTREPLPRSVVAGVATKIPLGSFTDAGGPGPFAVDVNWGDGSANSDFTLASAGSLGGLSHAFTDVGALTGRIIVRDASGVLGDPPFSISAVVAPPKNIVVNTIQDQSDPAGGNVVSLRDAVRIGDSSFGPVAITFDPTVFATAQTITLQPASGLEFESNQFGPISLTGPAAGVSIIPTGSDVAITVDQGITFALQGLTVNGLAQSFNSRGGGISNSGTMTITHCTFTNNEGALGGGIYNTGDMTISDSTITGNTATTNGGGVMNSGTLSLTDCVISQNQVAEDYYGQADGIENSGGTIAISDSTISGNSADGSGPAISIDGGSATIIGSTISGNSGAALYNFGQTSLTNDTVSNNSGGGIANERNITVYDTTVAGNTSSQDAGISNIVGASSLPTFTLANTIVAGNIVTGSAGSGGEDASGPFISLGHNLIGQTDGSTGWTGSDVQGSTAQPLDPRLWPLGFYSGPTQTMPPILGSPALNAGSVALIPDGVTTDQRGLSRVVNGLVDIGAVEVQYTRQIVVSAPTNRFAVAGQPIAVSIGAFTSDGAPGQFTVDVHWNDGSPDTFLQQSSAGSLGSQARTFTRLGNIEVSVTVLDGSDRASNTAIFDVSVTPAAPVSIVVNTAQSQSDPAGSKTLSLQDAIAIANSSFGPVSITFDPAAFAMPQTITLAAAGLEFGGNTFGMISITGPVAGVTIDGNQVGAVIVDAGASVSLSNLSITDGSYLGGIDNNGTLAVHACAILNNIRGSGINNYGLMTLTNSTLACNVGGLGGAVYNAGAMMLIEGCTIWGNSAQFGGGIYNINGASLTLGNSIVAGNWLYGWYPVGPDIDGVVRSLGHNLIGITDGSAGWLNSDQTGTSATPLDPMLGILDNHGGPTQTLLPLPGSPAVGRGSIALVPADIATDERGDPRTCNGAVDIGAVEVLGNSTNPASIMSLDPRRRTSPLRSSRSVFG
ncbi:MAG TPA: right-handed parallel beta-helix repeat-containing protein [Tepidisphaeraceae bacterium]|nr:right-handed parallel beta-helix repeat-containing protein [Tepidisphaeraceae bacterium]